MINEFEGSVKTEHVHGNNCLVNRRCCFIKNVDQTARPLQAFCHCFYIRLGWDTHKRSKSVSLLHFSVTKLS